MSRRKQGRPKGGRAARHHEPQGLAPPPLNRHDPTARDLVADGRAAVDAYFARKHEAEREARKGRGKG